MVLSELRQQFYEKCKSDKYRRTDIVAKDGRVYGHISDYPKGFDYAELKRKIRVLFPKIKFAIQDVNTKYNALYGTYYDYWNSEVDV
jgi:hypothetical protein